MAEEMLRRKNERTAKFEKNQEVRNKINKAVSDYKEKEENYRKTMQVYNEEINKVQQNLQAELLSGSISQILKVNEKEKTEFEKLLGKIKAMTSEI